MLSVFRVEFYSLQLIPQWFTSISEENVGIPDIFVYFVETILFFPPIISYLLSNSVIFNMAEPMDG